MHYEYKCACGRLFDDFRSVDERQSAPCSACGQMAELFFNPRSLGQVQKPFMPYLDENISEDGSPVLIESREHRKRLMKQNGLDWVPGVRWI